MVKWIYGYKTFLTHDIHHVRTRQIVNLSCHIDKILTFTTYFSWTHALTIELQRHFTYYLQQVSNVNKKWTTIDQKEFASYETILSIAENEETKIYDEFLLWLAKAYKLPFVHRSLMKKKNLIHTTSCMCFRASTAFKFVNRIEIKKN